MDDDDNDGDDDGCETTEKVNGKARTKYGKMKVEIMSFLKHI
jgi:hypothetical protein